MIHPRKLYRLVSPTEVKGLHREASNRIRQLDLLLGQEPEIVEARGSAIVMSPSLEGWGLNFISD